MGPAATGPIQSPSSIALLRNHAEQDVANQFVAAVNQASLSAADLDGKTLAIHISNLTGVCSMCKAGLGNPAAAAGVLKQLSLRYPGLTIRVTVEGGGVPPLVVRNGVKIT